MSRALGGKGIIPVARGLLATVVERLGLGEEGLVRAGCACYTTGDEIERLIAGVDEIAQSKVQDTGSPG